jgi:hypothetical protein
MHANLKEYHRETSGYLFSFTIKAHSSNIERNFTTKSGSGATEEAPYAIFLHGTNNGLPYIVKYSSLQALLKNLTRNTDCGSQDCAAEGSQ